MNIDNEQLDNLEDMALNMLEIVREIRRGQLDNKSLARVTVVKQTPGSRKGKIGFWPQIFRHYNELHGDKATIKQLSVFVHDYYPEIEKRFPDINSRIHRVVERYDMRKEYDTTLHCNVYIVYPVPITRKL
jgi:hypothetical protein